MVQVRHRGGLAAWGHLALLALGSLSAGQTAFGLISWIIPSSPRPSHSCVTCPPVPLCSCLAVSIVAFFSGLLVAPVAELVVIGRRAWLQHSAAAAQPALRRPERAPRL